MPIARSKKSNPDPSPKRRTAKSTARRGKAGERARVLQLLQQFESRNITFLDPDGSWPIVWERASGVHVWDTEGTQYLDITSAFGVASTGHANPRVVAAAREQSGQLLHAMGDVHPHRLKAELARELSALTFERCSSGATTGKTIFCNSGFEAVETALKTAALASGKPGVIAFTGAYHGLGYGALNVTERAHFRSPFISQLGQFGQFVPFPENSETLSEIENQIRALCAKQSIGAVLVEPIQGRAGVRIPSREFLPMLRRLCNELNLLLICDEIFTGFGRTGKWFASEHTGTVPDLICLGKALTGGFPLSACVGTAELMDRAWPPATGEAIHTSTFLGHPVGCAMALAQIAEIKKLNLVARSAAMGKILESLLGRIHLPNGFKKEVRVLGLMGGVELKKLDGSPATDDALTMIKAMLREGYILLPEGEHSNVISFTPPLIIAESQLKAVVKALDACLQDLGARTSARLKPRISKGPDSSVASGKKTRSSGLKSALR